MLDVQKQLKAVQRANTRVDISTGDAASIASCSKQTVINYIDKGDIVATRMGSGPRRVSVESFRKFLRESGKPVPGFTDAESSSPLLVEGAKTRGLTQEAARKILLKIIPVFNDKSTDPKSKIKKIAKLLQDV
jgi:hypothetical protein